MQEQEVIDLMASSQNETEWNANCDKVKAACGGYPPFWYAAIMLGGILREYRTKWGQEPKKTTITETEFGMVITLGDPE